MRLYLRVVVVCLLISLTTGQDKKSCRSLISDMNRKQFTWINQCVKQLGYKTGREKSQKSACVMKCVLANLGMLSESGFLDQNQFNKYLEEQWPEHLIQRVNATFQPCLKIGGTGIDSSEEYCKGYDPLIKCLNRNYSNLCRGT